MKKNTMTFRACSLVLIIPALFPFFAYAYDHQEVPLSYQPLIQSLSKDGFDVPFLSAILTDPRAKINLSALMIYLNAKEIPERYQQFLTPETILLSKKFLSQNLKTLRKMETRFHVEKEVVVAILLVESRFGENIGKHRVIPTLATMALMDSPKNIWENYLTLREVDPDLSYESVENFARRRSKWAYHELKCFLNIIRHEKVDPLEVYGSYAGALGMAQFIPSSYLAYALNQKSFENWLLSKEEAIFSIGNYLNSHGWKRNLTIEKKKQVLSTYNRSDPYVETILQIAQKIKNR